MSEEPAGPEPENKPTRKRIKINLPKDLMPVYANVALISHAPEEIIIEFAQVLPRHNHGTIQTRVIMTPMHVKMLHMALSRNLANYESKFGQIRIPQQGSTLADSFFRTPQDESGDEEGEE